MSIPTIKFVSLDKVARTATFDVGGKSVTRRVPKQFEGTIDDYLNALVSGLAIEFSTVEDKVIEIPSLKSGAVVVAEAVANII